MLYMFTTENLRQYAVLNVMGAPAGMLIGMIFAQAGLCAVLGTGLGLGLCGIVGQMVSNGEYPFRMMWFTPVLGVVTVVMVSLVAAAISARPLLTLQATTVFTGR
jgi:putative ABC transport system permease protein